MTGAAVEERVARGETEGGREPRFRRALRAVTSPSLLLWTMNARLQLYRCTSLPMTVRLRGNARIENYGGRIEIGDRVLIDGRTVLVEMVAHRGARIEIGERTYLNYGVSISAHESVSIGRRCQIGNYTIIMDNDYHDVADHLSLGESAPIVIEDNVWIGARATILKGVRIGANSVIGAGAVVTRSIPPNSVAAGVPARVIREL